MQIDIVDIGLFLVLIACVVGIVYLIKFLKAITESVIIFNKSIEKTQQTMDEINTILNNTNKLTENVKEISDDIKNFSDGIKDTVKTVESSFEIVKRITYYFNKFKPKKPSAE